MDRLHLLDLAIFLPKKTRGTVNTGEDNVDEVASAPFRKSMKKPPTVDDRGRVAACKTTVRALLPGYGLEVQTVFFG